MATMSVDCQCGLRLRIAPEHAGRQAKCPGCGRALQVSLILVHRGPDQQSAIELQPQVQALTPPPILDLTANTLPAGESRSQLRSHLSMPVWITAGVLNLCLIVVAVSIVVSLRSHQQTIPPAGPALAQIPTPNPAQHLQDAKPVSPAAIHVQTDPTWIGKWVVQKNADFKLRAGNQLVEPKGRFYSYRVELMKDDSVELKADEGRLRGWAAADQVIPIEQGINYYTEQIRSNSNDAFSYAMRGILRRMKGELDIALADLNEAIRLGPPRAGVLISRGITWSFKHDYDRAVADYSEAIRLDPQFAAAYSNRGDALSAKGEYDKAIADYDQALRLDPQVAMTYYGRGYALGAKRAYDQSIADLTEAIRLDPQLAEAYALRGAAWKEKEEYDKAITDLGQAIRHDQRSAGAYYVRGLCWSYKKENEKAIADFDQAIRLNPQGGSAYHNRGLVWGEKREYDKAIADFSEGIRLDPGDGSSHYNRGIMYTKKQEYDKAIADYAEALRLDPAATVAHYYRAVALFLAGRDGALEETKTFLEAAGWRHKLSMYAVLLGYFSARRTGQTNSAKALLKEAAARCDTSAWPFTIIKYLLGKTGETRIWKDATDNDKMTEAYSYFGLSLLAEGRTAEAGAYFRWVKDHGNPEFFEFSSAVAELKRLEAKSQRRGVP